MKDPDRKKKQWLQMKWLLKEDMKMKRMITLIMVCVMMFTLVCGLTGCSSGSEGAKNEKAAVCYVLANTANSQGLNLNSPMVQDTIYDTVRNYGYISIVNADGIPDIVLANSYDIDAKYKSASKEKLDMDARSKTTNLIAGMQGVIACDPEVDYLASLNLAVRSLLSLEGYDFKTIVVIGTGLSTSGVLDFQNNLISADPNTIVELLKEKDEIPDFSGMTVYWQQMGDVAAPQQALTSAQRNTLQQIYGGIVEAGGGTFVYNNIIANPVNESASYPAVTPVEFPADTPISFEPDILDTNEDDHVFTDPVVLTEEQVTFIGDKSEYLYPEEAESVLKPIADYLACNQVTILLCGTTAGDTNSDFAMKLSQERADTVKQTLVKFGADPNRIIAVGLGSSDPWHIYGVGYDSAASSTNRKTVIVNVDSDIAKKLLNQ